MSAVSMLAIQPGTYTGMSGRPITFSADVIKECCGSFEGTPLKRHHMGQSQAAAGSSIGEIYSSTADEFGNNMQHALVDDDNVRVGDGASIEIMAATDKGGNVLTFVGEGTALVEVPACKACRITKVGLSSMTAEEQIKTLEDQVAVLKAEKSKLHEGNAELLATYKAEKEALTASVEEHQGAMKVLVGKLASFRQDEMDGIVDKIKTYEPEFDQEKFAEGITDLEVKKKVLSAYLLGREKAIAQQGIKLSGSPAASTSMAKMFSNAKLSTSEAKLATEFMGENTSW